MTAEVIAMLPRARRPRAPMGARALLKLYPKGGGKDRYWLYAMGFAGGVVKLGRTRHPRQRLGTHWSKANGAVEWVHLFGSGSAHWSYLAESRACELAGATGNRIRKSEWFEGGLSREAAIKAGRAASLYATNALAEQEIRAALYKREQEIFGAARAAAQAQINELRAAAKAA